MRSLIAFALALCLAVPAMAQTSAAQAVSASPAGRDFVVFFQEWSGAMDGAAQKVVADVAAIAKADGASPVIVTGYADPTGSARANALVSALRAQMVADALVEAGVKLERIEQRAEGGIDFAMNAQESRRVTIGIGTK